MRSYFFFAMAIAAGAADVQFNRDVRPILSDKCFACHGPDAKAKGIALRLDSEEAAKRAIVPGDVVGSKLIRRITAAMPAMRMPPVSAGVALTAAEIETLRAWVEQGAKWEGHWAFLVPVKKPGTIDTFIRERLSKEGLTPSAAAPMETLIRRATLDLTGLPPTVAEFKSESY